MKVRAEEPRRFGARDETDRACVFNGVANNRLR